HFFGCGYTPCRLRAHGHLSPNVLAERRFGKQLGNLAADGVHGCCITARTSPIPGFNKRHERFSVFSRDMSNLGRRTAVTSRNNLPVIRSSCRQLTRVELALPLEE